MTYCRRCHEWFDCPRCDAAAPPQGAGPTEEMADPGEIRTHLNALAVSAPSGDEKCGDAPSVDLGSQPIGFVVWDQKYDLSYRGHIYESQKKAEAALASIVWHSRERYAVRPIALLRARSPHQEAADPSDFNASVDAAGLGCAPHPDLGAPQGEPPK